MRITLAAMILFFVPWMESSGEMLNDSSRVTAVTGLEVSDVETSNQSVSFAAETIPGESGMGVSFAGELSPAGAESGASVMISDSPALTLLKNRFNSDVLFRAELSHQFTDSYTGETTSTYGTIWFSKDMYKIDTPDQLILVRDRISTVYNKRQKRVIYSNYDPDEDEFAPSRYFTGRDGAYISSDVPNADGSITIKITTEDPFEMFSEVNIRVSREGSPVQIDAVDQMENSVRTTFRFGRFENFQNAVFTIQYPDDAEVVDMRQ